MEKAPKGACVVVMVPKPGIEPGWGYPRGILSPLRLPVPPLRHRGIIDRTTQEGKGDLMRGSVGE